VADERHFTFLEPEGLLAHYTSAAVVFEHVLSTGSLRMSPYSAMRDPAENKDLVPGTAGWGEEISGPEALAAWMAAVEHIKVIRDSMRVLSLTRESGGPGGMNTFECCWARPRMWEQYGDAHRGTCLVFDRDRLEQRLNHEFDFKVYLGNVRYTQAGIAQSAARTIIDQRIFDPEQRVRAVAEYVDKNYEDFYFLKTDDFASEHEFRAVLMSEGQDFAYVEFGDALVAVILGERFPDWQIPGAQQACEEGGVELRKMHWERGRPYALPVGAAQPDS
jgi:hypothetical protein